MAIPDLSSIITPEQVSAQLGVNSTDISADTIRKTGAYDDLYLDYNDWFPKVMDLINDTSGDDKIQLQQLAIKSYGKFYVCYKLLISGPLSFFQKFGDGENDDRRFNIDFEKMKAEYQKQMDKMKATTLGLDTPMTPAETGTAGFALFGVSVPSTDIVRQ